jgi:hypothetical protein
MASTAASRDAAGNSSCSRPARATATQMRPTAFRAPDQSTAMIAASSKGSPPTAPGNHMAGAHPDVIMASRCTATMDTWC